MEIKIAGIDYSYSCPAIAIYCGDDDKFSFEACRFFYLIDTKKYCGTFRGNIKGELLSPYKCDEERYDNIACWAMSILIEHEITHVFIEGYSMGSSGKVFNIAENAGCLKNKMWSCDIPITTVPPTTVKKFARGKGSGNKDDMHEAFQTLTGINLQAEICPDKGKVSSPVGDIVDAFFILKYGINQLT